MRNHPIISISLSRDLLDRIDVFVENETISTNSLTVKLMPYQYDFYKLIEKGKRSQIFSCIIHDFLKKLEKNMAHEHLFISRGEFVRISILYYLCFNNHNEIDVSDKRSINGPIPIGNIYHPHGDWKERYNKHTMSRYYFLEKIHEKLEPFISTFDIICNFEIFYKMYTEGLFDEISNETISEIKKVIKNSNSC